LTLNRSSSQLLCDKAGSCAKPDSGSCIRDVSLYPNILQPSPARASPHLQNTRPHLLGPSLAHQAHPRVEGGEQAAHSSRKQHRDLSAGKISAGTALSASCSIGPRLHALTVRKPSACIAQGRQPTAEMCCVPASTFNDGTPRQRPDLGETSHARQKPVPAPHLPR
jgi:hypothetical protein